uniref:NADH-ubiquinone oxidoreductase chain 2 n=1 Tax=Arria pallida TaxID=2754859 RepID=A0A7G6KSN1_9NEOP|nr:NADH dehydrogenase subunit 2 [Arria pallida]QNC71413.1 NADH dehydrogenase subunit 2 [Arria pallida]
MPKNSTKILFLMMLISGVLISLCANSWMGVWMGLEINLLSFIPLLSSSMNMYSTEASLKYFLIQAIASSALLFMIILKMNIYEMFYLSKDFIWNNLLLIPFLMKIACAPLHWWLPSMIEGLSWFNCFILLTIQKISPLVLISYLLTNSKFSQLLIMMSALIGAIGGLNQISTRKILTYSSINHIGWMLMTTIMNSNLWLMYFIIYTINISVTMHFMALMNAMYISQAFNSLNNIKMVKFMLFMSLLSLGGLPPFLGFFPKWIVIHFMAQNMMIIMSMILIMTSLLTLYYYIRIFYTTVMITNSEMLWTKTIVFNKKHSYFTMFNISNIILGMLVVTLIVLLY